MLITTYVEDLLEKARAEADEKQLREQFESRLEYLSNYACHTDPTKTKCVLTGDWAPFSFGFVIFRKTEDPYHRIEHPLVGPGYERWFNGGLIYHGRHDNGGDGGAPTFSVNLSRTDGWSIHT